MVLKPNKKNIWFLSATLSVVALFAFLLSPVNAQSFDPTANQNTNTAPLTPGPALPPVNSTLDDLNTQIAAKKAKIADLQLQASVYQTKVDAASGQVHDLQSQVAQIDNQVALTNFQIQSKQEEISSLELEIAALQQSIDEKTANINDQKSHLGDSIRRLDQNSRTSTLALLLTHGSLAEFYSQAEATASLSQALQKSIGELNTLRADLQTKQDELTTARDAVQQNKAQLEVQKQATVDQLNLKNQLLSNTQQSANQYDALVKQAALEEQQANATISALESEIQHRLNGGIDVPNFTSTGYIWPVGSRSISAYFHDADYPYERYIGPHSGLDIRTPQGTAVRATADGIVSVVHDQGRSSGGSSILNYVGIVHDKGIASRYLHLVKVLVYPDQFVHQGDVIGLSGGIPGTEGAGSFSSGAHLHFEIRVNGIPDDPLKYLPGA